MNHPIEDAARYGICSGKVLHRPLFGNPRAQSLSRRRIRRFSDTTSGAATVNAISAANYRTGQRLTFRTTTANMTFANTAQIKLAGAVIFTGPGILEFQMEQTGSTSVAYETSRTVF